MITIHKCLVFGGRTYSDARAVSEILTQFWQRHGQFAVIEGGASGADRLAREWGQLHGLPVLTCAANWNSYKKAAGFIRNQWMLDYAQPTYAIGFPGGPGTADMARRVAKAGVALWQPFG